MEESTAPHNERFLMTDREQAEAKHGQVWNTTELQEDFQVISFMAPYVKVKRKLDNQNGSMEFTHSPRFYFDFAADPSV